MQVVKWKTRSLSDIYLGLERPPGLESHPGLEKQTAGAIPKGIVRQACPSAE